MGEYVSLENLYKFAAGFIRKHLARNPNWVRCGTSKCEYGFMILDADTSKKHKLRCGACKKKQTVSKDPIQEEGFDELIKSGVLRLCPKCALPEMWHLLELENQGNGNKFKSVEEQSETEWDI